MTPLQIELLLHIYARRGPLNLPMPVHHEAIEGFKKDRLIEMTEPVTGEHPYRLTERGEAYVQALLSLPLPVAVWQMPVPPMPGAYVHPPSYWGGYRPDVSGPIVHQGGIPIPE